MTFLGKIGRALGCASVIALAPFTAQTSFAASNDILFVLDGSGSMWGQIDGVAKIETAKTTMARLINDVPSDARLGFMTYGTNSKESCTDVSLVNAIGTDKSAIVSSISNVTPLGKTPIQKSLIDGLNALQKAEPSDVQKSLVLISDGIETCDGDPCSVAATAQERGVDMKVHVVGFDVDADARAQLECIAKSGGGQYFDASDTEGFTEAMQAVVKVAQVATPQPIQVSSPAPAAPASVFFEDDFDGEALATHWTMSNANEDSFIVEAGELLLVSNKKQGFNTPDPENLLQLNADMPRGDWDMNLYLKYDAQTTQDHIWFGLYSDVQNYLSVQYWSDLRSCSRYVLRLDRMAKGERTNFDKVSAGRGCGYGNDDMPPIIANHVEEGMILTLSKRGRAYTATARIGGLDINDGNARKVTSESLTSLRVPGKLAIAVGKWSDVKGEVLSFIDRVEIVPVN